MNERQWGFRKNRSTESVLLHMTEKWREKIDQNQLVGVLFLDFQKAFDSVNHEIIKKKLQAFGISGNIYSWIVDYLSNRKQLTVVNGVQSTIESVSFGVPQGSLLGPTLFTMTSSDLTEISTNFESDMFADDTTSFCFGTSTDIVLDKLQLMANEINQWANNNNLFIHPGKSKIMLMSAKSFTGPLPAIILDDQQIEIVNEVKCLGVKIDNKLLWKSHVNSINKQFSAKVKNLYSMRNLSSNNLCKIYLQGIFPSIIYAISVWGNCCDSLIEELKRTHRKAV